MAIQLGSAYGKVSLDVAGLLSGVKKGKEGLLSLANIGQQLGGAMKNVGNMMTLGVTLPIVAMGAASIKAASDFEETKNKAVVVFGEMADSVVASSNKAATALGISKTQYLDYASSIGAALTAGGMGIKESTELAEGAVKHFADLASFHNARVEDVALAWQSAIRGQYEPIQRYFPFITDSYLKTYGIANGLVDENTKTLTANQRAIILNAIALNNELNPALDDFAETSGGLANQGRILKAQWQDALVMLGQNLLPIALKVVSALNKMLESFNNLSPTQQKIILGFLAMAALAGPLLSFLGTVVTVGSSIASLAGTVGGLGISLSGVGAAASTVVIPALAAIAPILIIVLALLAGLALQIGLLYLAWKTNFLGMRDNITAFVSIIKSLWKALMAFLHGDTDAALEYLGEAFQTFVDRIQEIFSGLLGIRDAWNNFVTFLSTALGRVRDYIVNTFTKTDWGQIGKYILFGLANGMLFGLPTLLAAAARIAASLLAQIKRSLGISSPSREAMKLGMFTGQGYMLGLMNSMDPNALARMVARPVTNTNNSQQQNITMQFAGGLTTHQVQGMISQNNEALIEQLNHALGGA